MHYFQKLLFCTLYKKRREREPKFRKVFCCQNFLISSSRAHKTIKEKIITSSFLLLTFSKSFFSRVKQIFSLFHILFSLAFNRWEFYYHHFFFTSKEKEKTEVFVARDWRDHWLCLKERFQSESSSSKAELHRGAASETNAGSSINDVHDEGVLIQYKARAIF